MQKQWQQCCIVLVTHSVLAVQLLKTATVMYVDEGCSHRRVQAFCKCFNCCQLCALLPHLSQPVSSPCQLPRRVACTV